MTNDDRTESKNTWRGPALRIALGYLSAAALWILFSDTVVFWLTLTRKHSAAVELAKGLFFVLVTAAILYAAVGRLLRVRERALAKMRASEERFSAVFERGSLPMWALDAGSLRFLSVNDAAVRAYGYSRDEFMKMTLRDIRPPEDLPRLEAAFAPGVMGRDYVGTWRHRLKDGRVIDVMMLSNRVPWPGVENARLATAVDVSDRVGAERATAESEARYRLMVETAREGIWMVDTQWRTTFANAMLGRLIGLPPEQMIGRHVFDFMDERAQRDFQDHMRTREQGGSEQYEFRFRRADGSEVLALLSSKPIKDHEGGFAGSLAMLTDITERHRLDRERDSQARVLEAIAAGRPIEVTLDLIIRTVQARWSGTLASVLLLEGTHLRTAAAPDLPGAYSRIVDGLEIGPSVGSCGTAMYRKQRVIVSDIASDPLWASFRDMAAKFGLRACWSEPILDSHGQIVGSLAMYRRETHTPGVDELRQVGSAAHLAGIAVERWRDEKALRESEATKRAILDALPDMIFRVDRDMRFIDCHVPDPSLLTIPVEKFLGSRLRDVLPADRAEATESHLRRLFDTGEPQAFEVSVARSSGALTWDVRMVLSKTGEAVMISRNVTVERAAQRDLRESQRLLELLVKNTPLGVILWDEQFHIASWNPASERIFGWSRDEAVGKHWSLIVPPRDVEYVKGITGALMANAGGSRGTNTNVCKDGRIIWCEWYNTPLADETGKVLGIASVVEDVTERREAERRQALMMRELDHRVKNNLASITSLAEQTARTSRTQQEFLEAFTGRLRAMVRLHTLLTRSHGEGVDVTVLVRQTLETFAAGNPDRAGFDGPAVLMDARAGQSLAMALNELATNAAKYGAFSTGAGRVTVSWSLSGEEGAQKMKMTWTEQGGPEVHEPSHAGFGTELIQGMIAHELRGSVSIRYNRAGLECLILIPLTRPEAEDSIVHPSVGSTAR